MGETIGAQEEAAVRPALKAKATAVPERRSGKKPAPQDTRRRAVSPAVLRKEKYYLNRELTWLNFNFRILDEARDRDNPLLKMDNVILSPHSAACSDVALEDLRDTAMDEVIRSLRGRLPMSLVNPDVTGASPLR